MNLDALRANREKLDSLKDKFKGANAFKIMKFFKKLDEELSKFEEFRNDLIRKYGKESEEGNIEIKPETPEFEKFIQEYAEAAREEIEFKPGVTLSMEEVEDAEYSARDLELFEAIGIIIED